MKKMFINACVALAALGVMFLAAEAALRVFMPGLLGLSRFRLVEGNFEYANRKDIIRPSDDLGYELIPGSAPGVNSLGMFDRERRLDRTPGTVRILFVGDSVTANGRIPAFLEEKLNAGPAAGPEYEVWNCALGGYQISQYAKYVERNADAFRPDVLLLGICLNDFDASMPIVYKTGAGEFYEYYNNTPRLTRYFFSSSLFRVSYVYRFIIFSLERVLRMREERSSPGFAYAEGMYWLQRMDRFAAARGLPVYAVIYPYMTSFSGYDRHQRRQYEVIRKALKDAGIRTLDLVDGLKDEDLSRYRRVPDDCVHPDAAGDDLFAERIAAVCAAPDGIVRTETR